jgi:hypothetical protein
LDLFPPARVNRVSGAETLERIAQARQEAADFWA